MSFAFLYAKKFSRDGHFKYLLLSLDRSVVAFLCSLVINLAWFPLSFFIFKGTCLPNTLRKNDVNMLYIVVHRCMNYFWLIFDRGFVRIHYNQMFYKEATFCEGWR